ncbi:MAG TPA: D-2-hydroxyacid dehydrogenase [Bryobacteraceae bacterium]|nr:D-2-hydroxyacid dehydrogenase [Bryobacteraceae bacterium]
MAAYRVLVIAPPNARYLSVLEQLPSETTITVGDNPEAFTSAAAEADIIVNGLSKGETLRKIWPAAKRVKWVHSLSAGVESMLFPDLISSDVPVTNARGVFKESLGEFTIASILFFAKDLRRMLRNQQAGRWEQFDVDVIYRQSLGVIGYGELGQAAARRAKALGMRVNAARRRPKLSEGDPSVDQWYSIEQRAQLMADSDYVLCAAALTPETVGLVGPNEIGAMKTSGVIINIGRGPVIDEPALIDALATYRMRGAALDGFNTEPLPQDHPFWKMENVLLSPHCADHTSTWMNETVEFFVHNFERYAQGQPLLNLIDKKAGY